MKANPNIRKWTFSFSRPQQRHLIKEMKENTDCLGESAKTNRRPVEGYKPKYMTKIRPAP